ncbi:hypothetical protein DS909_22165 [Phaeobacter gallaeciensis]|uniref:Uncharacterized protein n=2 Tax=Roseobacteraceae TaxID=2854170 RepID=A0A366WIG8_9RHOB|nr:MULTISPECIES: hypothetical protein [Roseobacteraceae]MBT3139786.1 hypothetical protein [Falsiruegeria litorea]RBW49600.1 hypothetical protein DS909_22165 [Phaeobacter gallaeciensis]
MQFDIEFDPETPLERAALRAVRTARGLVRGWRDAAINVEGLRLSQLAQTLERLEQGDLFNMQDETILDMLEKTLVKHLNEMREGYGTYALRKDTNHDDLFCPDLEKGRVLMERWKAFKSARQHVTDLRRARIIADQFS